MKLFKVPPPPQDLVCQPENDALVDRNKLIALAEIITSVTTARENEHASECGTAIQKQIKEVESARKELTAPYLEAQRAIKRVADDFCSPLLPHLDRLGRLSATYRAEQERKAEAERQVRTAEILRLQEAERAANEVLRQATGMEAMNADLQAQAIAVATDAAIRAPIPEATKTTGQSFQAKTLCWECTDINALWAARPDLCEQPKPKASAIKATCTPERPVPGLRLWWEAKVSFRSKP